jgi:hypothetical protein
MKVIQSKEELLTYDNTQVQERIVVNNVDLLNVNDAVYAAISTLKTSNLTITNATIDVPYLPVYDIVILQNCYIVNMDSDNAILPRKLVLESCSFDIDHDAEPNYDIEAKVNNPFPLNFIAMQELVLDNIGIDDTTILLENIMKSKTSNLTIDIFTPYIDTNSQSYINRISKMGNKVNATSQLNRQFDYIREYYPSVNTYTRRYNEILNEEMRVNVLSQVAYILYEYMMKAGKHSHKYLDFADKILTTYRGIPAEYDIDLQVGKVITNNAFTSTSLKKETAVKFAKEGKILIYNFYPAQLEIIPIFTLSYFPHEAEVVINPYYNWQVRKIVGNEIYLDHVPGMSTEEFTVNPQIDDNAIRACSQKRNYENYYMSVAMLKSYMENSPIVFPQEKQFHYDEKVGLELLEKFLSPIKTNVPSNQIVDKRAYINAILYQDSNLLNLIIAFYHKGKTILPSDFNVLTRNLFLMEELLNLIRSDEMIVDAKTIVSYLTSNVPCNLRQVTVINCHFSSDDNLDFTFDEMETLLFRNCTVELAQVLKAPATQIIVE